MASSLPVEIRDPQVEQAPITKEQARKMAIALAMSEGQDYRKVAGKLSKGDKREAKRWRHKLREMAATDGEFQHFLIQGIQGQLLLGLGPATQGLIRRAAGGNVPAIKLLYEATNFHNPKVQHEHSGEIKISFAAGATMQQLPRPEVVEDVVEADVVEVDPGTGTESQG